MWLLSSITNYFTLNWNRSHIICWEISRYMVQVSNKTFRNLFLTKLIYHTHSWKIMPVNWVMMSLTSTELLRFSIFHYKFTNKSAGKIFLSILLWNFERESVKYGYFPGKIFKFLTYITWNVIQISFWIVQKLLNVIVTSLKDWSVQSRHWKRSHRIFIIITYQKTIRRACCTSKYLFVWVLLVIRQSLISTRGLRLTFVCNEIFQRKKQRQRKRIKAVGKFCGQTRTNFYNSLS